MRIAAILLGICCAAYVFLTAYAGYLVARGIDDAKAKSVVTRVGAHLLGRDAIERIAIRQARIPGFVTGSPAFWIALRATE